MNREVPVSFKSRATPTAAAEVAASILRRSKLRPTLAIQLGSGFQHLLASCTVVLEIPYASLPGFAMPDVPGHLGKFVLGSVEKIPVVLLGGRSHYYEGKTMGDITFPIRVLAELGIKSILLTNAAGGINSSYRPGDFMCVTDHINFMGENPLRGAVAPGRRRFIDMTDAYNRSLRRLLQEAADQAQIRLHHGVFLAVSGPSFETPAEIRAFGLLGADAVGMSTVPETIVARQCGLKVAALACITNLAAGRNKEPLSHHEVLETGKRVAPQAAALIENFVRLYASH
ncbi:purine-nucleoside phosphorylase [Fontisphaera persica]|uniref:purine-nucleoside phosphorylase n=1 Tax=Fontisphaera persica TaxID=2974023 RepID=UPI0024BF9958|nr:purine-nucleoside phosphorylase [Fontisphaera persica]WCJ60775.1 purine-nucleoside phosphorylase [Fontisphaera persica]